MSHPKVTTYFRTRQPGRVLTEEPYDGRLSRTRERFGGEIPPYLLDM